MKEFIALKLKAYSYTTTESDQVCNNTLKGVPKHIRNSLNLETYKECLYSNMRISKDIFNLRFYNKEMSLTKNSKIILSSFEDKRYYVDSLNSYGYGHHKMKKKLAIIKEPRVPQRRERKEKESQKKLWIYLKRKRN